MTEPTIIRHEDQIIVQPQITMPTELAVDLKPVINVTLATQDVRRDIILAVIAAALIAGLFL